ncbi:MAG: aspartate aminotransferase family protein [Deltaproteobacteria bacterium]|nr:aspartate aminotransferase family protein [Deltaproteobacteria bacterium]
MEGDEFRKTAHETVDWICDYLEGIEGYPVVPGTAPGEIRSQLPDAPPEKGESMEQILEDFRQIIVPGMTHWQHPGFMAYFPANHSQPSLLAEMLTAALGAQCMSWQTSPAATELEEQAMIWLRELFHLPDSFTGVIESGASFATLSSLLTARESRSHDAGRAWGLQSGGKRFTTYCSEEAHSSIDRAVRMSGLGESCLRKIPTDAQCRLIPSELEKAICQDLEEGNIPLWISVTLGSTGTTATDPVSEIAKISTTYGLWMHVDAAYVGPCLMLPEYAWMLEGLDAADSLVINPHKWMPVNFDCSAYFVRDVAALIRTWEILPEYLKSCEHTPVNNYRDWGPALGRRFRALKLWFVLRYFGREGLSALLRKQISFAQNLAESIRREQDFELMLTPQFNLLCFRYRPVSLSADVDLDTLNQTLLDHLNRSGHVYLSHTRVKDSFAIRLVTGQTRLEERHVQSVWNLIRESARKLHRPSRDQRNGSSATEVRLPVL